MWIVFSLLAAALWGLVYTLDEQVYHYISVPTSLAILSFVCCVVMLIISIAQGSFVTDVRTIMGSKDVMILLFLLALVFTLAELFIGFSISSRNATLAAIIEIAYPLFTVLFGILLFKQNHLSTSIIIGGLMIAGGVAVISLTNK